MSLLRVVLVTLVCLGLGLYLGRVVIAGLVSGKVAYRDSKSVCARRTNPAGYWSLIVLFAAVTVISFVMWGKVVYEAFDRWVGGA